MAIDSLKRQHIFEFLTPNQMDTLSEASEVIKLEAGEMVYEKGARADYFYVILEGAVALRLPARGSASVLIDELAEGATFGPCVSPSFGSYFCTSRCVKDSELLRISTATLKKVLDSDTRMGYAIQSRISELYHKRHMNTMRKLQAILMSIPIDSEEQGP